MPRTDPIQGITSALATESPDGAANEASIVDQIVLKLNMRFATTTARDAAITPSSARKAGMRAWIDALGYWTTVLVDAGSWVREDIRDAFTGTESVVVGSTPPAGTLKIRQEFTTVQVTTAGGGFNAPFPTAFPNGIISVVATAGDNAAGLATVTPILSNCNLSNWNLIAWDRYGAVIVSSAVRCNVFAVGW